MDKKWRFSFTLVSMVPNNPWQKMVLFWWFCHVRGNNFVKAKNHQPHSPRFFVGWQSDGAKPQSGDRAMEKRKSPKSPRKLKQHRHISKPNGWLVQNTNWSWIDVKWHRFARQDSRQKHFDFKRQYAYFVQPRMLAYIATCALLRKRYTVHIGQHNSTQPPTIQ